ncbi:MAG: hypothetical protein H3C39_01025 [Flavobacteriia bacterium]|nr:hypothetical protein [Flavobacteriia bacterium]
MKNLFLCTILIGLFFSCNQDDTIVKLDEKVTTQDDAHLYNKSLSQIDKDETPDLSNFYYSKGSSNFSFQYDNSRQSMFNESSSQLRIPVSQASIQSNLSNLTNVASNGGTNARICICIAKMKESQGCYYCVNCLGFRCSGCCDGGIPPFEPQSRSQSAEVTFDNVNQEIVFQFNPNVDWQYLKQ